MSTLYGISNCDTIRKARQWLKTNDLDVTFHDVRKDGLEAQTLNNWIDAVGWETLLNKRGTTFRQLPEAQKDGLDATSAAALMLEHPAMIKRPVLDHNGSITVGFKADNYQQIFNL